MPARCSSFLDGGGNVAVNFRLRNADHSRTHSFRVRVPPRTEFAAIEYCKIYFSIVRKIDSSYGSKDATFENCTYPRRCGHG